MYRICRPGEGGRDGGHQQFTIVVAFDLVWRVSEAAPILQMPDKKARGSFATQADWSRELSPSAGCWDPPAGRVEAGVGPQASAKRGEAAPPRHAEFDLTAAGGVWGWAMQWGPGRVRPGEGGGREKIGRAHV